MPFLICAKNRELEKFQLNINGASYELESDPNMPLLWALRDVLGLTGTRYGCGIGQCGACTVLLNDRPVRSCSLPVATIGQGILITIENTNDKELAEVKEAWKTFQVPQCGYCQSGQLLSASALIKKHKKPNEEQIESAMKGNLCRCGTYPRIKKALQNIPISDR